MMTHHYYNHMTSARPELFTSLLKQNVIYHLIRRGCEWSESSQNRFSHNLNSNLSVYNDHKLDQWEKAKNSQRGTIKEVLGVNTEVSSSVRVFRQSALITWFVSTDSANNHDAPHARFFNSELTFLMLESRGSFRKETGQQWHHVPTIFPGLLSSHSLPTLFPSLFIYLIPHSVSIYSILYTLIRFRKRATPNKLLQDLRMRHTACLPGGHLSRGI